MKKKILFPIIAAMLVVAVLLFLYGKGKTDEPITTTGIVEGTEVNLSSRVSGKISEFCCREGDRVSGGQTLVKLESDEIEASVEQAMATVFRTKADIASSEASVKNSEANLKSAEAEIESAHADMEMARAHMQEAEKEMNRAEFLYKDELISNRDVDLAITSQESTAASFKASEAKLKAATAKKDAASSQLNASRSILASARARLKEAEAALKVQEARLDDTVIRTPLSGTVVLKAMEAGEVVSPGITILSIVDLYDLWVRIDLEETVIGHVKIGDEATIHVDGMPGVTFNGAVAEIGKEADFATQRDVTRGRQDIKTFGVKIKTTDKTGTLKPGMTVMVDIPRKG